MAPASWDRRSASPVGAPNRSPSPSGTATGPSGSCRTAPTGGTSTGSRPGSTAVEPVAPLRGEIGTPAWVFGQSRYAFLTDGRVVIAYAADGTDHLAVLRPSDGTWLIEDLATGYTALSSLQAYGNGVAFVAGSPLSEPVVAVADLPASGPASVAVVRPARDLGLDPAWMSRPEPLALASRDGGLVHALYYPPTNPVVAPGGYDASAGPAPLLVMNHGGPTSAARPQLSLAVQFWTSRGFGVVDVNYRGQHRLRPGLPRGAGRGLGGGRRRGLPWPRATSTGRAGRADPDRLAIRGGSAGGFTALRRAHLPRPLPRPGPASTAWPISRPSPGTPTSSRSRYLDGLVGPYPERRGPLPGALSDPPRRPASSARSSCCRASRTRSCPRPSRR